MRQARVAVIVCNVVWNGAGVSEQEAGKERPSFGVKRPRPTRRKRSESIRRRIDTVARRGRRGHVGTIDDRHRMAPPEVLVEATPPERKHIALQAHAVTRREHAQPVGIVPARSHDERSLRRVEAHERFDSEPFAFGVGRERSGRIKRARRYSVMGGAMQRPPHRGDT